MVELTGRGGRGEMDCVVQLQERVSWHLVSNWRCFYLQLLSARCCLALLEKQPALAEKPFDHDVESVRDGGPLRA
jgi:hypothetical protein